MMTVCSVWATPDFSINKQVTSACSCMCPPAKPIIKENIVCQIKALVVSSGMTALEGVAICFGRMPCNGMG